MPKTILESLSNFIDDHLRLFRLLPWAVGTCGVLLLYKHSRSALQRFPRARDIPHSCVEAHLPLYGVVVYVCENGMDVWHVPLWRRLLRMGHRPSVSTSSRDLIRVRLAGVCTLNSSHESTLLLKQKLSGQIVTFVPLCIDGDALESIVYTRVWLRRVCVNTQLVKEGLAQLGAIEELPNSKATSQLVQRLMAAEIKAKKWKIW